MKGLERGGEKVLGAKVREEGKDNLKFLIFKFQLNLKQLKILKFDLKTSRVLGKSNIIVL